MATLEGQSHFSAAPEAFRQGLRWIWFEDSLGEPNVSVAPKNNQPSE